jgi:hypothetical protein
MVYFSFSISSERNFASLSAAVAGLPHSGLMVSTPGI